MTTRELERLHDKSMKKSAKTGKPESKQTSERRAKLSQTYASRAAMYKALTGGLIDEFRTWELAVARRHHPASVVTCKTCVLCTGVYTTTKLDDVGAMFLALKDQQVRGSPTLPLLYRGCNATAALRT